jgi:hypothetical protein
MLFQTKSQSCLPKTLRCPYNLNVVIVEVYNVNLLRAYPGNVEVGVQVCDLGVYHLDCPSLEEDAIPLDPVVLHKEEIDVGLQPGTPLDHELLEHHTGCESAFPILLLFWGWNLKRLALKYGVPRVTADDYPLCQGPPHVRKEYEILHVPTTVQPKKRVEVICPAQLNNKNAPVVFVMIGHDKGVLPAST